LKDETDVVTRKIGNCHVFGVIALPMGAILRTTLFLGILLFWGKFV